MLQTSMQLVPESAEAPRSNVVEITRGLEPSGLEQDETEKDSSGEEPYAGWVALVQRIQSGETDGMEELYQLFSRGIRFYLCRHWRSFIYDFHYARYQSIHPYSSIYSDTFGGELYLFQTEEM